MKIYARLGESEQTIDCRKTPQKPDDTYIEMKKERPDGNYIAGESGEWVEVTEQKQEKVQ